MQSKTMGPVVVFHVSSLTITSLDPSAYSTLIWKSIRGVLRHCAWSKSQESREWQLYQPLPSITPIAFAPCLTSFVTSCVT